MLLAVVLALFSNKVFFNEGIYFFLDIILPTRTLNRLQYKHNFNMQFLETKKFL